MAGTGGAVRATGWRATAIPFQQLRWPTRINLIAPPLARARRVLMTAPAARRELRGGARQHPRFNNAARRAVLASLAERSASPWTATSMRDRPCGCSTCASSLCGAVRGNGRWPAADVDGLLVAIGRVGEDTAVPVTWFPRDQRECVVIKMSRSKEIASAICIVF